MSSLSRRHVALAITWLLAYELLGWFMVQRPLWYDEILTWHLGQLPTLAKANEAARSSIDLNPPFFYLVSRFSLWLGHGSEIVIRIPPLVGFAVMSVCLMMFVGNRLGPPSGIAALIIPSVSGALPYASEARPYGIVLGMAGIAIVSWQVACQRTRLRPLALLALWLSSTLALLSHAYAFPLPAALLLAECVRSRRSRVDAGIIIAVALSGAAALTYGPILSGAKQVQLASTLFSPVAGYIAATYRQLLAPGAATWLGAILVVGFWRPDGRGRAVTSSTAPPGCFTPAEMTLALGLVAAPLMIWSVARLTSGAYLARYGLLATPGLTIIGALVLHRLAKGRDDTERAVATFLTAAFVTSTLLAIHGVLRPSTPAGADSPLLHPARVETLEDLPSTVPIVSSSALQFVELAHYGPVELRARLRYLTDRRSALKYTGSTAFDRAIPAAVQMFGLDVQTEPFDKFVEENQVFYVYGPYFHSEDWTIQRLIDDGAALQLLGETFGRYGNNLLLRVDVSRSRRTE